MRRFVIVAAAIAAGSALVWSAGSAEAQCIVVKRNCAQVINPAGALNAPTACERTRARIVTRSHPISPPFVVTTPIASRGSLADCREPGPGYYGLPAHSDARIYVRIRNAPGWNLGLRAVGIDPFQHIPAHLPQRYHQAQQWWLYTQGLVQRARIVKRVAAPVMQQDCCEEACEETCIEKIGEATPKVDPRPTPRATIKLAPAAKAGGDQRV